MMTKRRWVERGLLLYLVAWMLVAFPAQAGPISQGEGALPTRARGSLPISPALKPLSQFGKNSIRISLEQDLGSIRAGRGFGASIIELREAADGAVAGEVKFFDYNGQGYDPGGGLKFRLTKAQWSLFNRHIDAARTAIAAIPKETPAEREKSDELGISVVCLHGDDMLIERRVSDRDSWIHQSCVGARREKHLEAALSVVARAVIAVSCGYVGRLERCGSTLELLDKEGASTD
jgi:hypothetical protein